MKIEVIGKNGFTPSQANKEYAVKKLKKVEEFFGEETTLKALVVCKVYKTYHKVEVTIPTKSVTMRAEAQDETLYGAIDKSVDKLLSQIRKYKTRVKSKLNKEGIIALIEEQEEEEVPKVVRSKEVALEPMSQEEAITQMELLGHDFFIYLDENTHKTNVIYLRDDGSYAVIETK